VPDVVLDAVLDVVLEPLNANPHGRFGT